jgi:hypothetical protein
MRESNASAISSCSVRLSLFSASLNVQLTSEQRAHSRFPPPLPLGRNRLNLGATPLSPPPLLATLLHRLPLPNLLPPRHPPPHSLRVLEARSIGGDFGKERIEKRDGRVEEGARGLYAGESLAFVREGRRES